MRILDLLRRKRNEAYEAQSAATTQLQNAWTYLHCQFWRTASAQERGVFLPEHREALDIVHRLAEESLDRQCSM